MQSSVRRAVIAAVTILISMSIVPVAAAAPDTSAWPQSNPAPICDNPDYLDGPTSPPAGAVVVNPGTDLGDLSNSRGAGTTFWLASGVHTLGTGQFDQVVPKDANTYIGAPGAVLDGQGVNNFAFTQGAENVTIRYLTIRNFVAPAQQGVVNHDSASNWTIEHSTIEDNSGAGIMGATGTVLRYNCIRDNGQYGFQFFKTGDGIRDVVVEHNEITGNNTDDWETIQPGCGCSGATKFWAVTGATIVGNWIHDNRGSGLWADTNNVDFLIEGNLIENNDGFGLFYETSYNAVVRNNVFRGNAMEIPNGSFPSGAIYLSESGGDSRLQGSGTIAIDNNLFTNNRDGVVLWENPDRFCNSPYNASTGYCTPFASLSDCAEGTIDANYHDCRWKTQNVAVVDNYFEIDRDALGCGDICGRNGLFSNYGTVPDWSPYQGDAIRQAITFEQNNQFAGNLYAGEWRFVAFETARVLTLDQWRAAPYHQDGDSVRAAFEDVFFDNVFYSDIVWLADRGITRGCNPPLNTRFCPDSTVTRGQMAAFLVRALGLPASSVEPFDDDDSSEFEADIQALAAAGITRGCDADSFCPDRPVTRGEMAAFLVRAYRLTARDGTSFTDDDGSVFQTDIEVLATAGVTRGCNPPANDRFCPDDDVTREQMAAFLHRAET